MNLNDPREWVSQYVFGTKGQSAFRTGCPGSNVLKHFSAYVPRKPVVLYRYVEQMKGSGATGQELRSWTHSKEFAEFLLNEGNEGKGKVIKKTIYPDEILVDTTLLPRGYDIVDSQQEVIVAYGRLLKEMRSIRDCQSWSGSLC